MLLSFFLLLHMWSGLSQATTSHSEFSVFAGITLTDMKGRSMLEAHVMSTSGIAMQSSNGLGALG